MEAPERIGTSVGAGGSTPWPRAAAGALRGAVQLWIWPMLLVSTLGWFLVAHLTSLVLGRRRAFAFGLRRWARTVIRLGGCTVEIEGEGPLQASSGAVVVANHQGFGDILVLAAVLPGPVCFAARRGLFRVPLLGSVLRAGGHLTVRRGGPGAARSLVREAAAAAAAGRTVVFFPEGTRSAEGRIEPLLAGAFHAAALSGRPLLPLVLSGSRHLWTPGTLRLLPCRVVLSFLSPWPVDGAAARSHASRARLRDAMAARLGRLEPRSGPRI
jgi:1-acyl-sn-glycerol-3-phosphate acyltransferase